MISDPAHVREQYVPELERALDELARVLGPGGSLVATTNAADHLAEVYDLAKVERFELSFGAENGEEFLKRHFHYIERVDAHGTVTFRDAEQIRSYLRSSACLSEGADRVPDLTEPLVARRRPVVFFAAGPRGGGQALA